MKYLATLLLILGFGLSAFGQTIKSLGYNTTNGQIVANTGASPLTFTSNVTFLNGISGPDGVGLSVQSAYELKDENGSVLYYLYDNPDGSKWEVVNPAEFRSAIGMNGRLLLVDFDAESTNVILQYATNNWTIYNRSNFISSLFGYGNDYSDFQTWGINVGVWASRAAGLYDGGEGFEPLALSYNSGTTNKWTIANPNAFRANLGFSTNLNTLWTAENTIAARQALGLQSYTNTLTNSVGDVEIGSTVNSVTIGWTISPTNATYALRRLVGAGQTNNITNNSSTLSLTSIGLTNNTSWTLTVGDGSGITNTATTSVNFYNYMTWGRSANTSLNNAQIQSLHTSGGGAGKAFATDRSRSITMDGGGQYLYIAYPQGFGSASFVVGGLPNSAFTAFTNSYTNANGYITNYLIYRTDTIQNGTGINIVIQ